MQSDARFTEALVDAIDEAMRVALASMSRSDNRTRNLFDDVGRPVFFDMVHLNEAGASLVATDIYRTYQRTIRQLARHP